MALQTDAMWHTVVLFAATRWALPFVEISRGSLSCQGFMITTCCKNSCSVCVLCGRCDDGILGARGLHHSLQFALFFIDIAHYIKHPAAIIRSTKQWSTSVLKSINSAVSTLMNQLYIFLVNTVATAPKCKHCHQISKLLQTCHYCNSCDQESAVSGP